MYGAVQLATSLLRKEVDRIDVISARLGNTRWRRAGTLRAMLRFALAHEDQMVSWFEETEGKPLAGGDGD
jgi:hypothetical protein